MIMLLFTVMKLEELEHKDISQKENYGPASLSHPVWTLLTLYLQCHKMTAL